MIFEYLASIENSVFETDFKRRIENGANLLFSVKPRDVGLVFFSPLEKYIVV